MIVTAIICLAIAWLTGATAWEYYQPKAPSAIEPMGKSVALLFDDELQVVKALSL